MDEQIQQEPLVGPLQRHSWRAILGFRSPTMHAHTAVVRMRGGRVFSILPANGQRVLSDFLLRPYQYREVDMRVRPLVFVLDLESVEFGYQFHVTLQLAYQVIAADRVALEHADVLAELVEAITQRARAIARTLGVDRASLLKEYLTEVLTTGNELPQRFVQLGLALRRVDLAVELAARERAHAAAIAEQNRERPFRWRTVLTSADQLQPFAVRVGGFFRLDARHISTTPGQIEQIIEQTILRVIAPIAASHPPAAAGEATRAMTEAIWNHSLLKADLAAAGITLLRPQVEIEQTSAHQPVPQTPVEPPPAAPPPASDADVFRWDLVAGHATPAADTPPFPPPSLPADSQEHESAAFRWDLVAGDSPPAAETFPRERQTQPEAAAAPDPTDDESAAFRWDLVNDEPPSPAGESQFRWGKASPPAPPPPPSPAAQPRQVFQWNQIEPVEPAVPPPAATSGSVWWNQMAQQSGVPASEPPAPVDEHMAERIESWVRKIRQQHGDQALTLVAHEPDNLPQLLANLGVPASECFYATDRYHQQALLFALRAQSTHQPKEPQP